MQVRMLLNNRPNETIDGKNDVSYSIRIALDTIVGRMRSENLYRVGDLLCSLH